METRSPVRRLPSRSMLKEVLPSRLPSPSSVPCAAACGWIPMVLAAGIACEPLQRLAGLIHSLCVGGKPLGLQDPLPEKPCPESHAVVAALMMPANTQVLVDSSAASRGPSRGVAWPSRTSFIRDCFKSR